jgi:hypothetical protein
MPVCKCGEKYNLLFESQYEDDKADKIAGMNSWSIR